MSTEAVPTAIGRTIANPVRMGIDAVGAALSLTVLATFCDRPAPIAAPLPLLILPLSQLALYVVSGFYHGLRWTPDAKRRWQRADHAMIYVKIAGSATGLAAIAGLDPVSHPLVQTVWLVGVAGVAQKVWLPRVDPRLSSPVQLVQALVMLPILLDLLESEPGGPPDAGTSLLLLAIVLQLAGFVVFVTERPRLWPGHFGFHDLFHVLLVLASLSVYGFVAGRLTA